MGMLSNLYQSKDATESIDDDALEEQYQKMFKKIARDFIYKDDFGAIMSFALQDILNGNEGEENFSRQVIDSAVLKAIEYRNNLNKPLSQRRKYKDIIDDE